MIVAEMYLGVGAFEQRFYILCHCNDSCVLPKSRLISM